MSNCLENCRKGFELNYVQERLKILNLSIGKTLEQMLDKLNATKEEKLYALRDICTVVSDKPDEKFILKTVPYVLFQAMSSRRPKINEDLNLFFGYTKEDIEHSKKLYFQIVNS